MGGLRGWGLSLARAGWVTATLFVVVLFVAAVPVSYGQIAGLQNLPEGVEPTVLRDNLAEAGLSAGQYAAYRLGLEVCFAAVCLALGAWIFRRRSDEPVAHFVSLLLVLLGTTLWGSLQTLGATYPAWRSVVSALDSVAIVSLFVFFYLFPDGRFVPRWTRWIAAAALVQTAITLLFPASSLNPDNFPAPLFVLFLSGMLLTGVYAQVHRYRRVSGPVERQQTKWVVFGFAAAIGGFLGVILFAEVLFSLAEPGTVGDLIGSATITAFMLLIPFSIGFAILRRRLFDIDLVINRTLVYGTLTTCVVGIYVLIVGYLGALLRTDGNLAISLVATGIVAMLFQPLRDRLQRIVNRLMYGERDDPYAVISRLGERLEATLEPGAVLPTVAQTVREALKLPYAAVALGEGKGSAIAAEAGSPVDVPLRMPLVYRGETVGELLLGTRAGEEDFSPADRRLLDDLTRQAGVAVHAVRLTDDLRRSRERLVTAREEERRRLRRDLHDGLGPTLGSLPLKLDVANDLVQEDPAAARELLRGLKAQSQSAVADIRRLVYELRPPALDDLGLVGALREIVAQHGAGGPRVAAALPKELPPLPAAVEVAVYRIAQEALTNVARHSGAKECHVRLTLDEEPRTLRLEIEDDGRGIGGSPGRGVGLHSMRERAEELGGSCVVEPRPSGGTRVSASLPVTSSASQENPSTSEPMR